MNREPRNVKDETQDVKSEPQEVRNTQYAIRNTNTKSLVAVIAGFSALGLFLMGLIYWAAFTTPSFTFNIGQWDVVLRVLMVAAIIAFSIYLIVAPESVGAAAGKRSTRLAANALVASLVAIGIGIAVNIIILNVPAARADVTAGKDFTLSDQTLKVLQDIDAKGVNIQAVAFQSNQQGGGNRQQMEDLLKEYASHTSHLKYEFVDPYTNPARANALGVTRLGTVVFDNGKKREFANSITEADFTSALVRLGQNTTNTVAFLSGHGERDPEGVDQTSYGQAKAALVQDNYRVLTWNLVTSPTLTISDVTVLIIAAPQKPLSQKETQTIQQYLDSGGHALILMDPQMPADAQKPLADILTKYGVTPVQGVVLDRTSTTSTQDPSLVLVRNYPANDITTALASAKAPTIFPAAMGLKPPTSTVGSFAVMPIIQSSPGQDSSWLETDLQNPQVQYNEGKDLPGPVVMGLSIGPSATGTTTDTAKPNTRLVVYSDADFPGNIFVQQVPANLDLFSNSVSWLAGQNALVSIRAKDATAPRTLTLDSGQKNFVGLVSVFALPVVVLLAGTFIWWRRR